MLLSNLKNKLNSLLVVNKNEINEITLPKRRGRESKNTDNSTYASSKTLASTETISSTSLLLS